MNSAEIVEEKMLYLVIREIRAFCLKFNKRSELLLIDLLSGVIATIQKWMCACVTGENYSVMIFVLL